MINSPSDIKNYFKEIATGATKLIALQDFYYGDTLRIIEGGKDSATYPMLWCETFEAQDFDNHIEFNGAISIIYACEREDAEAQDTAVDNAFNICTDIISRLVRDGSGANKLFQFKKTDAKRYVIAGFGIDYAFGIRMELKITGQIDHCYDAAKWAS